jgi:type IV secretory pathway TraG/TraD family ATPase VirD4/TPR repeat protein
MSDRLGTAQWEEQALVSQRYPFEQGKFWLGRAEDGTPIGYRDDRHICLVSGTRGGKGTSVIVNNLCFWPGSAVVVDPKGENATVTAARRGQGSEYCEGLAQAVHVLDPFKAAQVDESYRSSFNPLDVLDPNRDESIDEASRIANAIVVVKDDAREPFWDESARTMLRSLILYVLTAPHFGDDERNLITVRNLILRGEWQIFEGLRDDGFAEETIDPPHLLLWRNMERNPAFDGLVAGIGRRFRDMMKSADKTFDGILQSVAQHTEFLDSPGMKKVLAKSDFKLSELKTRPEGMTLYLSLPQRYMDTHYRWLRMMVALTTTEMEITRGQPATGHPVLMVLDEFAGLKRMTAIESAVAQIAGFGVKLFFVLQSLEQLKGTYKDHWETFLSNAGVKIFFGIEDHFTREYVSKLVGQTEITRKLHSENKSRSQTEGYSETLSKSHTVSQSRTTGKSVSLSTGTNESTGWSEGESFGMSYQMGKSFFFSPAKPFNTHYSQGGNTSRSASRGSSSGNTFGRSVSETSGTSETIGISQTHSISSSTSAGTGTSESLHVRPLIHPDELGRVFARIDDTQHPGYPGLALVTVTGFNPMVAFRKNYFEDVQFIDCFSPHPDHQWRPAISHSVDGIRPLLDTLETATNGRRLTIARWLIERGKVVFPGQPAAIIERVPPDDRTVRIFVPCLGKVAAIAKTMLSSGEYPTPDGALFVVKSYQETSDIDPLRELREACRALERLPKPELPKPPASRRALTMTVATVFAIVAVVIVFLSILNKHSDNGDGHPAERTAPVAQSPPRIKNSTPPPNPSGKKPRSSNQPKSAPAGNTKQPAQAPSVEDAQQQAETPIKQQAALLDRTCSSGNGASCRQLGMMYYLGQVGEKDVSRAVDLYTKACNVDDAEACETLGKAFYSGTEVPQNTHQAVAFLSKGCDLGLTKSCGSLGIVYDKAHGLLVLLGMVPSEALALISKGCDAGDLRSCNALANAYINALGVSRDYSRGLASLSKACDGGFAISCESLAKCYRLGIGVVPDAEKARQLNSKACTLGYQPSCQQSQ